MKNKRLYNIWSCMKQRCNNPNHTAARWYHDKGIRVCPEWLNFETFQEWALSHGYREDLSIDRINSDKNYCPENCQWIPLKENISKGGLAINRNSKIPKYRVWECERWNPEKGKKIRLIGEFPYKKDARDAIAIETAKLREETLNVAIERKQEKWIIERIIRRDTWLKYEYVIEKI